MQSQKAVTAVTVHSSSDQLLPWPLPSGFAEQLQNNTFLSKPFPARLSYLHFQPLEVVSRYRDPQLHVAENYSYLFNLRPNIDV